jgi:hypothetical protein
MKCTVELAGPPITGFGSIGPPNAMYDFTGMPAPEALATLVTFAPDLEWRDDGGIYRIRSRALPSAGMALDRVVASVDQKTENVNDVFAFIRSIVSGDKPPQAIISVGPTAVSGQSDRNRTVTLKMTNVTVRQILDEVARQYGDSSWSVRYTEANGIYPELMLTISVGTSGTGVTMSIK